jgi:hypothetical protein
MATRGFRNRKRSVAVEHPDGGTFHLLPYDTERALQYAVRLKEIAESKSSDDKDYVSAVKWVDENVVEKITGVVDEDTREAIDVTPEVKLAILMESSDRLIERDIAVIGDDMTPKVDGGKLVTEKKFVPANEPIFMWAISEAAKLVRRKEAAAKNS